MLIQSSRDGLIVVCRTFLDDRRDVNGLRTRVHNIVDVGRVRSSVLVLRAAKK